jgi:hypothetical protein
MASLTLARAFGVSGFLLLLACTSGSNVAEDPEDHKGSGGNRDCSCSVTVNGAHENIDCGSQACVSGQSYRCDSRAELTNGGDGCTTASSGDAGSKPTRQDAGPAPPPTDADCTKKDKVNCYFCCSNIHDSGWSTWNAVNHACYCKSPGACNQACAQLAVQERRRARRRGRRVRRLHHHQPHRLHRRRRLGQRVHTQLGVQGVRGLQGRLPGEMSMMQKLGVFFVWLLSMTIACSSTSSGSNDGTDTTDGGHPSTGHCSCSVTVQGVHQDIACGEQACVASQSYQCGQNASLKQSGDACQQTSGPGDAGSRDSAPPAATTFSCFYDSKVCQAAGEYCLISTRQGAEQPFTAECVPFPSECHDCNCSQADAPKQFPTSGNCHDGWGTVGCQAKNGSVTVRCTRF